MNVAKFMIITGIALMKNPYITHNNAPVISIKTHLLETSVVDLVLQDLSTCGHNASVVKAPAANPIIST